MIGFAGHAGEVRIVLERVRDFCRRESQGGILVLIEGQRRHENLKQITPCQVQDHALGQPLGQNIPSEEPQTELQSGNCSGAEHRPYGERSDV